MLSGLRKALVCLLLVAAGQVPLPWSHCHDSLTPEELAAHLKKFHQGCPPSESPSDWHFHFSSLDLADPEKESAGSVLFFPSDLHRSVLNVSLTLNDMSSPPFEVNKSESYRSALEGDSPSHRCATLFKQFGAFLI
jgi:hypothetical protein